MNRLADETSPYLRQHRDNPVDWYPWGPEAFAAATERNVPILLSVGYSACHWCHVMAHECFEDVEVAQRMNELFVNVKVDREERPDVDAVYMDAVQAMTGRGGWPMTVFMTPEREPFYGGTYFPKAQFLALMTAIDKTYRNKPDDIRKNVTGLVTAIDKSSRIEPAADMPDLADLNRAVQGLGRAFDTEWGGFGKPPKFPSTFNIELMLRAYMSTAADTPKTIVTTTLDAMASGGMYDHIGGGFARYSTDREWLVPHFEKMLYDQALLCKIYLHGMIVIGAPQWRQVLTETITYVLTTLRHPDGGFFSAEDADSPDEHGHGVEGLFHTWTPAEVRAALSPMTPAQIDEVLDWFEITEAGNFAIEQDSTVENSTDQHRSTRSIPTRTNHRGQLARPPHIEAARRQLSAVRSARRRPGLDDKVLTEWNALFTSALAEAGAALDRKDWLDAAVDNAEFLIRELRRPNGRWMRSWHADGEPQARHAAFAADHAALVDMFTRLAEATGQARWIDEAVRTADTMLDWYWDPDNGGLYTTAEDAEALVVRQKDLADNATPSANSMAATALYRLAALTGEQRYQHHADRILQLIKGALGDTVGGFTNALLAADLRRRGLTEVAIVGDRPEMVRLAHSVWRPDMVLAWGEPYESPLWENRQDGFAYVCRDYTCQVPQDTLDGFGEALLGRPVKVVTEAPAPTAPRAPTAPPAPPDQVADD